MLHIANMCPFQFPESILMRYANALKDTAEMNINYIYCSGSGRAYCVIE